MTNYIVTWLGMIYIPYYNTARKRHLKVVNDIFHKMNRGHVTLLVLHDLSAAFDTVDHNILLQRLDTSFGITDSALIWFKSYLSDRSQHVIVDGAYSDSTELSHGVLQGSCLGPLLVTIYASKLFEGLKTCLPIDHFRILTAGLDLA